MYCLGEACRACPRGKPRTKPCGHDSVERHSANPIVTDDLAIARAATPNEFSASRASTPRELLSRVPTPDLAENRVPTEKLPPTAKIPQVLAARVIGEFNGKNGESIASFFDMMAMFVRVNRQIAGIEFSDDGDELATFFETMAKIVRLKHKLTVICE